MNVARLIEELQRHPPGKEVRVCLRDVTLFDDGGDWTESLTEADSQVADDVRNEGGFVLIWGGKHT